MMVRDEVTNPAKNKRHALRGTEEKEICQIVTTGLILMKPPPLVHLKEDVKAVFLI